MTSAKRASIVLPLAGLSIVLALAIATQQVACAFHYPAAFGYGLFDVGRTRIYAPWSFALWYARFARSYQQAFDLAALIALAVALLPTMMAIGLTRGAHRKNLSVNAHDRLAGTPAAIAVDRPPAAKP